MWAELLCVGTSPMESGRMDQGLIKKCQSVGLLWLEAG